MEGWAGKNRLGNIGLGEHNRVMTHEIRLLVSPVEHVTGYPEVMLSLQMGSVSVMWHIWGPGGRGQEELPRLNCIFCIKFDAISCIKETFGDQRVSPWVPLGDGYFSLWNPALCGCIGLTGTKNKSNFPK